MVWFEKFLNLFRKNKKDIITDKRRIHYVKVGNQGSNQNTNLDDNPNREMFKKMMMPSGNTVILKDAPYRINNNIQYVDNTNPILDYIILNEIMNTVNEIQPDVNDMNDSNSIPDCKYTPNDSYTPDNSYTPDSSYTPDTSSFDSGSSSFDSGSSSSDF